MRWGVRLWRAATPATARFAQTAAAPPTTSTEGGEKPDPALERHDTRSAAAQRLSAAARLGSSRVDDDSVVRLPVHYLNQIAKMARHEDKHQLHRDMEHLREIRQKSSDKTGLARSRADAVRFSLKRVRFQPLHINTELAWRYAILVRVFDEVRRRVVPPGEDRPIHLYDHAMYGSEALYAARTVFGRPQIRQYMGDARFGELFRMCSKLQDDPMWDSVPVTFHKLGEKPHVVREAATPEPPEPPLTIGVNAFDLSLLETDAQRERHVRRLWKSKAEIMVLIDHATPRGFASIAAARAQLLAHGRAERGSHVVAPCAHDAPCPVLHAFGGAVPPPRAMPRCSFRQKYEPPPFMREALKWKGDAHKEFCYVVVRRGQRPSVAQHVDAWAAEVPAQPRRSVEAAVQDMVASAQDDVALTQLRSGADTAVERAPRAPDVEAAMAALRERGVDEERVLQAHALTWPRLVRPPLKKGGHVTMDACTPSGEIQRFTVARSAGRQAYQDARKALHGDLYAHAARGGRPRTVLRSAAAAAEETADDDTPGRAIDPDLEHQYLGPDAQLQTLETGRPAKRVSSRAPKRVTTVYRDGRRASRKQSRGDYDIALAKLDSS